MKISLTCVRSRALDSLWVQLPCRVDSAKMTRFVITINEGNNLIFCNNTIVDDQVKNSRCSTANFDLNIVQ